MRAAGRNPRRSFDLGERSAGHEEPRQYIPQPAVSRTGQIGRRSKPSLARRGMRLKRVGRELIGPCPVCGGVDRFGVSIAKQLWNCRGCAKGGDVVDLVQHLDGVGFAAAVATLTGEQAAPSAVVKIAPKIGNDDDYERRQHAKAAWLWRQRQPITGTIAETYLREARGYPRTAAADAGVSATRTRQRPPPRHDRRVRDCGRAAMTSMPSTSRC